MERPALAARLRRMGVPDIPWDRVLTRHRLRQSWYMPVLASAMAIMFLRILVMARLIDLPSFGVYSAVLLVSSASNMLGCLGLYPYLQRELPMMLFHGRERHAAAATVQTLIGAAIVALLGLGAALGGATIAGLQSHQLAAAVLHGLSQQVFLVVTTDSRSRGNALLFGWENLWRAVLTFVVAIPVAAGTGSATVTVLAEAAVTFLVCLVIAWQVRSRSGISSGLAVRSAVSRLTRLDWTVPLSLLMVSAVGFASTNADRWLASEMMDAARFAEYAFAWTVMIVALYVQLLLNASIYPLIARRFAAYGARRAFRISAIMAAATLGASLLLLVPGLVLAPLAVDAFFPAYHGAVAAIPLLAFAAALRLADFWSSFLVVAGFERRALATNLVGALAGTTLWILYVFLLGDGVPDGEDFALLAMLIAVLTFAGSAIAALRTARSAAGRSGGDRRPETNGAPV